MTADYTASNSCQELTAQNSETWTDTARITQLLNRYAHVMREKVDPAELMELFADNGTLTLPNGKTLRRESLRKLTQGTTGSLLRHHVTTMDIILTDPGAATSETHFFASTQIHPADHWGWWSDALVCTANGWRIAHRRTTIGGFAPDGWYAASGFAATRDVTIVTDRNIV